MYEIPGFPRFPIARRNTCGFHRCSSSRIHTGWPVRLKPSFCWHQIESCVLVEGFNTVTELMFWHQQNLGYPVGVLSLFTSYIYTKLRYSVFFWISVSFYFFSFFPFFPSCQTHSLLVTLTWRDLLQSFFRDWVWPATQTVRLHKISFPSSSSYSFT